MTPQLPGILGTVVPASIVVGLKGGELHRFDLIYLVLDKAEEATDRKLARHLLSLHYERGQNAAQVGVTSRLSVPAVSVHESTRLVATSCRHCHYHAELGGWTYGSLHGWLQAPIPIDQLRDFIAYARSNCHPELCAEAATDIVDGYMHMRRMGSSRKVRPVHIP